MGEATHLIRWMPVNSSSRSCLHDRFELHANKGYIEEYMVVVISPKIATV